MKKAKAMKLSAKLLAVSFLRNTFTPTIKGIEEGLATGVLAGYNLVDVKVAYRLRFVP